MRVNLDRVVKLENQDLKDLVANQDQMVVLDLKVHKD